MPEPTTPARVPITCIMRSAASWAPRYCAILHECSCGSHRNQTSSRIPALGKQSHPPVRQIASALVRLGDRAVIRDMITASHESSPSSPCASRITPWAALVGASAREKRQTPRYAGIRDDGQTPLLRSAIGKGRVLTDKPMNRIDTYGMIRRRAAEAGFKIKLGCHVFRATGITAYLEAGAPENPRLWLRMKARARRGFMTGRKSGSLRMKSRGLGSSSSIAACIDRQSLRRNGGGT
jgi:hypothetical protein